MDSQYDNTCSTTTSASSLFDSQPQEVQNLLKGLSPLSSKLLSENTQPTFYQEKNMAQWHYNEEIPTSRKQSNPDKFSSVGTSADSMYGSKVYGDTMYGSKTYGDSMYGSETYNQPGGLDAPLRGIGGDTGRQGYKESSSAMGWRATGQNYYDGAGYQGGDRGMSDQGYHDGSLFGGGGSGTSGHGYNDSYVRGRGRGNMGQGSGGNTRGRGRGTRGQGYDGSARGRDRGNMGQGSGGNTRGRGRGTGRGTRGQGSDGSARGRGRGSRGKGPDGHVWGKGHATEVQGLDGGRQGRGRERGNRGYANDGNTVCGRESAKRGMPGGGYGSGPSAKKPKWQNEQQGYGEKGSAEHRWGAEQGWGRERIWRGRGRGQRGHGISARGARGKQGGPPQRNNPTRSSQEFDGSAVEYGFDGKLVEPERLSDTCGEYKHCKVCDVHINSMTCAKDHYSGKNHLKKLNAILKKDELIKSVDLSSGKCELCDVVYTSPVQVTSHLEGGRHKRNLEEAKAKAEGRTLPPESKKKKKPEGDKETVDTVDAVDAVGAEKTVDAVGTEKPLSGELPPSDVGRENINSQKGKGKPTAAERDAGGKQRQLFHCDLCGINTTSPELLAAHFAGKKHKQRMENIERKNSMCTATSANMFSCELCGIKATDPYSLNLHLIGKKHMKNLELSKAAQTKQLEPLMASTSHPPGQQELKPPEPENKSPLPPELFETEGGGNEELQPEGIAVPPKSQGGIVSAIAQSLQETAADMPELRF